MITRNLLKIKKQPASHEDSHSPGCFKKIILDKGDFPKGYQPQMINWAIIPEGSQFRSHYHQDMIEIFIIVRGIARIKVGKKSFQIAPGDTVLVPSRKVHAMRNIGKGPVEYYVVGLSRGLGGKTVTLKD